MPGQPFEPTLDRQWPIGEHFGKLAAPGTLDIAKWVELKLLAGEWYLETLRQLRDAAGDLDRLVGVEMALDGCLGSLSSAFDATVGGLILALERHQPEVDRTPVHRYSWRRAKDAAVAEGVSLTCEADVDGALKGERDPEPVGWLAKVRRLRNRTVHQTTLARSFGRSIVEDMRTGTDSGSASPTEIRIPGEMLAREPVPYLEEMLGACRALTRTILLEVELVHARPAPP